jgi:phosphatidylserine/phosphatidylglycerophosphate/cardiolipin synthase-like enzyme
LVPLRIGLDCDVIVSGEVVRSYQNMFDEMWDASSKGVSVTKNGWNRDVRGDLTMNGVNHRKKGLSSISFSNKKWTDPSCTALMLHSYPSSEGEDIILRHVIGAIGVAKESIFMCMGHCNIPMSMSEALGKATKRGVRVSLLINSMYSCDLRNGQRDLFLSLRDLLVIAPSVEVWVTVLSSQRQGVDFRHASETQEQQQTKPTPFLHSKYVIIDSKFSTVGNWNCWARASFVELESQLFVHSKPFAKSLEKKFHSEKEENTILLKDKDDCNFFCPQGCSICRQFGPFYT